MKTKPFCHPLKQLLLKAAGFSLGLFPIALFSQSALSADRITTYIGPAQVSITVDELEQFAQTGEASGNLNLLLSAFNENAQTQFRQVLNAPIRTSPEAIARLSYIPMVEQVLQSLGHALQTDSGLNGFKALRSSIILASANHPEGWTLLDLMRQYPTNDVRLNVGALVATSQELATTLLYQQAAVDTIIQLSNQEAVADPPLDYAQLPDLSQPGPYTFTQETLNIPIQAARPTLEGYSGNYTLRADLYLPQGLTEPAPIVVYSHGWGGRLGDGKYIAEHLASYGFAVAVPEHIGTTDTYRSLFLTGQLGDITNPIEYVSRQLDITYLLDELERRVAADPAWANRLNVQSVGVMGQSLGGATALASAGVTFNPARYRDACSQGLTQFNPSFVLQCQSRYLPPTDFNFSDPRIRAAIAQFPMGATMFGPEGIADIDIPVLMLAGSEDILAPSVYEQIPMFSWLNTPNKYLALLTPGNHFSTSPAENVPTIPEALRGPDAAIGRGYIQGLSIAFFRTYLSNPQDSAYRPYLTASYAETIRQDPMQLYMLRSLTPQQLAQAYGGTAPGRDRLNMAIDNMPQPNPNNVLEDIRASGFLRVGIRSDASPFGYIDASGQWTGYCFDLADGLAQYLSNSLDHPVAVETIPFPSNLRDRFDLIRNGTIHLECGPNSIRTDVAGVAFSTPFFATGTQLLVRVDEAQAIAPNGSLAGIKTGVLQGSTTEQFVQQRYPNADIVYFEGILGTAAGVDAVASGRIDVFADDSVLILGELAQQNLDPNQFTLLPELPLTCDFYGLILPEGDPSWQRTVNAFNRSASSRQIRDTWFSTVSTNVVTSLTQCER